jgi:hypothetical protein
LTALKAHKTPTLSAPAAQSVATAIHHAGTITALADDKIVARQLEQAGYQHSGAWLTASAYKMNSILFAFAFRLRALAKSSKLPPHARCVGCPAHAPYDQVAFMRHAHGCASLPTGANSNIKHNACVKFLFDLAKSAGLAAILEPKEFAEYTCPKAGCRKSGIKYCDAKAHSYACGGVNLIRQGPDLEIHWSESERMVYDWTDLHATCDSLIKTLTSSAVRSKKLEKVAKYVGTNMIPASEFTVLLVFSLGGMDAATKTLLCRLADANGRSHQSVIDEIGVLRQRANGAAIARAHRASGSSSRSVGGL